jgi:hypothetical protein
MQPLVEAVAMLLLGTAAVVAWTGGWRMEVFGLTVSVRGAGRLLALALASVALRAALSRDHLSPAREIRDMAARVVAGALLVAGPLTWVVHLSPYAGGADSYGYVSAAGRIREGELVRREPLAAALPFANGIEAATPLGYVASARVPDASVPAYPLGLPALMAAASVVAGPRGPFLIAPVMGVVLVAVSCWMIYRWSRDVVLTLAAGAAVAFHPLVVTYAIQAMSDVPAAACFLLAAALLASGKAAALAGFAAAAAFLVRPALLPGAAALAVIPIIVGRRPARPIVTFGCGIAFGVVLLAVSQWYLYGHPLANGYGPASELFQLRFLPANARSYVHWLVATHGLVWIAGVMFALARIGPIGTRLAIALPFVAAAAPYAIYRTYDHWETLRFVLPLLVATTGAAVAGLFTGLRAWIPRAGTWIALVLTVVMIAQWVRWLDRERVFERSVHEQRFERAGDLVARATPVDAVVLASLHSGSIRYYASRQTLDWADIPPGELARTVAALQRSGHAVFVLLDGQDEHTAFVTRHGNLLDAERWLPSGQVRDVRMYEAPR